MNSTRLEPQDAEPVDEATKAAIELAEPYFERREGVTLEQANAEIRKRYQEWRETQRQVVGA